MRYRTYPFDKNITVTFRGNVARECGCVYDRFERDDLPGHHIHRFRERCATHAPMCRDLEPWEIDDLEHRNEDDSQQPEKHAQREQPDTA